MQCISCCIRHWVRGVPAGAQLMHKSQLKKHAGTYRDKRALPVEGGGWEGSIYRLRGGYAPTKSILLH
jgi:hypothetical protein